MNEVWVRVRVPQRQTADWIKKKVVNIPPSFQFSGVLLLKIILIMSSIILMQSGFLHRGHCVGIGIGDFYSYNEIILIGNILMVSVDCTQFEHHCKRN